jgi:mono/diheme cytochrome c family protein
VKRLLVAFLVLVLAAGAALLALTYSGLADVAASSPHWPVTRWLLSAAMESAVKRRAAKIASAPFLDDPERIQSGTLAYDAMCAQCHGAPGVRPGVVGEGLNPEPPDLVKSAGRWTPAEIFWITKHGVRMTGMPAFGSTHSDEELWEVVAVVKRLPEMSPVEYRGLANSRGEPRHKHRSEQPPHHEVE